ncbi:hypothetical protein LUZ60_016401 [Juncus effusus]|nr:hypothetical protein LUZ60_016401 [Juncus effusus]
MPFDLLLIVIQTQFPRHLLISSMAELEILTSPPSSSSSSSSTSDHPTWPNRFETLTHVLTHQTLSPSLHSQHFVSLRAPCFLNWSYPPFLCPSPLPLFKFSFSLYLSRLSRLGLPHTTWRSLCPFQQPPPVIISSGVDPGPERLGVEERREYARRRIRRKRWSGNEVGGVLLLIVPNIAALSLVVFNDGFWRRRAQPP